MRLTADFTTEPFSGEGAVPPHVQRTFDAVEASGLEHEFGPLGTVVAGDADALLDTLRAAVADAFAGGATRITLQIERDDA